MTDELTIVAVADTHYARQFSPEARAPLAASALAIEWVTRAVAEARRVAKPDVLVLLGDLLNDHGTPGAAQEREEFAAALRELRIPFIVVPGNHDGDPQATLRAFGQQVGACRVQGRMFYTFADPYAEGDTMRRLPGALEEFLRAAEGQGAVVLQHSPLYPEIDSTQYPYMPLNAGEIAAAYEKAGVTVSLSGHYHAGTAAAERNGVTYLTCAALTATPFAFYLVRVAGKAVRIERRQLSIAPAEGLVDVHVHSPFGYCAVDVNPPAALRRAELLGLRGITCVEHAGQLYLTNEEYWSHRHVDDPDAIRRALGGPTDRMARFRAEIGAQRSERLFMGIEVEVDCAGRLNLPEEERGGWDVVLGAVHWLPASATTRTREEVERGFMTATEQLVTQGITALAHPLRLFYQKKLTEPEHLYRPLARMLKAHGVAAEINYHLNATPREFFEVCMEEGVALAVGSDGHNLAESCDLLPHLEMLRSLGYPAERVWAPDRKGGKA